MFSRNGFTVQCSVDGLLASPAWEIKPTTASGAEGRGGLAVEEHVRGSSVKIVRFPEEVFIDDMRY